MYKSTRVSMDPESKGQIVNATLVELENDLGLALTIDFLNLYNQNINAIKFDVYFINSFGKFIFDKTAFSHRYIDLSIPPNTLYYLEPWELDERHHTARSLLIRVAEIHFEDGTRKYFSERKENIYVLPIVSNKKRALLRNTFGSDVITYGGKRKDAWRCVCGALNPKDLPTCQYCARNKDFVLTTLTESKINETLKPLYKKSEEELDPSLFHHQVSRRGQALSEHERHRRNEEENTELRPEINRKKMIFYVVGLILLFLALFQIGRFIYNQFSNEKQLQQAQLYIDQGEYERALEIYENLPTNIENIDLTLKIQDTKTLIQSVDNYSQGIALAIAGKDMPAIRSFSRVLSDDHENYYNAQVMISTLREEFLKKIKTQIEEGEYYRALGQIEEFIDIYPDDEEALTLREEILNAMK
ncbi:hypothetical protein LQU94_05985 [Peptoniphilus sp. KCTC 25270]|uniref:tetratricopeptide repeat protein n=1 Tax=Peptoniphilus sp. KCTC 25270 TaxID=2897414 RepID=UPI001E3C44DB|nr:hypothetical protein [Peptoniphilus sp. KCTC 25270]MCD1147659.1 hypothetical protein [Peptoniphilus sp. KCTC 25270]